jgi:hypothetical protein
MHEGAVGARFDSSALVVSLSATVTNVTMGAWQPEEALHHRATGQHR